MLLKWIQCPDDKGNTCWDAQSCCAPESESSGFLYRVRPILADDRIQWSIDDSDQELVAQADAWFASAEDAREECERLEKEILASES